MVKKLKSEKSKRLNKYWWKRFIIPPHKKRENVSAQIDYIVYGL
ncbi:MAG: hypothetical protein G01um101433_254 [Parcubacteria group bacterium Gr01-1014_33]|nr:MAG: hypothetical protein G01um101433_254 [Parcubacteria group bacterium Gr01-1014_33]